MKWNRWLIVPALIAIPTIAAAQQKEIDLKLAVHDVQLIGEALGTMPFAKVAPLMQKLQVQVSSQMKPEPEVKPEPKSESKK